MLRRFCATEALDPERASTALGDLRDLDIVRQAGRVVAEPSADPARSPLRTARSNAPFSARCLALAPYKVVVVTDTRHFAPLSKSIFRFLPLRLGPNETARMHGANERIGVREYEERSASIAP